MNSRPPEQISEKRKRPLAAAVKFAICLLFLLLTAAFETSFFEASGLFSRTPDLLLTAVAGLALIDGELLGAVAGIAAGVYAFALGGSGTAFMPVFYCLEGYFLGLLGKTVFRRNLLSWTVYCIPLTLARAMVSFLYLLATEPGAGAGTVLARIVLPEAALTFLFSYLSYFFAWLILRPFHRKRGKDDPVQLG